MIGNSGWKLAQDTFWACPSSVCTHVLFCNQTQERFFFRKHFISEKLVTHPQVCQVHKYIINDSGCEQNLEDKSYCKQEFTTRFVRVYAAKWLYYGYFMTLFIDLNIRYKYKIYISNLYLKNIYISNTNGSLPMMMLEDVQIHC